MREIERGAGAAAALRGPGAVIVEATWDWARRTLNRQRRLRLCAYEGVIGCGLAPRVRGGQTADEPCATVYVARKRPPAELRGRARLPRRLGTQSRALGVDVVELGELERHAGPAGFALRASGEACAAATVALPARPAVFPADEGTLVRLAGRLSGTHSGVLRRAYLQLPGWGLEHALLADVHSVPGDSGSPLFDSEGLLLGTLVGRVTGGDGRLRVFQSAAPRDER